MEKQTIVFTKEDEWLFETIQKIVEIKRLAGWKTSFSQEMVRLAKFGVLETLGNDLEKKIILEILRSFKNDSTKKPS